MKQKSGKAQKELIDKITPEQANIILRNLWASNSKCRKLIEMETMRIFKSIDYEEISNLVCSDLDSLDVEELWDRSGPSSKGYNSPEDMAVVMFEEVLSEYNDQLKKYYELKMESEAKEYCKGVLKGIYDYATGSNSKFLEWATDVPEEMFGEIHSRWKKDCRNAKWSKEMDDFISTECKDWAKWVLKA